MKPWHLTGRWTLSYRDRLRVLFGVPLFVRFTSPDGTCHAACEVSLVVQQDWPGEDWPADLVRWRANLASTGNPYTAAEVQDDAPAPPNLRHPFQL